MFAAVIGLCVRSLFLPLPLLYDFSISFCFVFFLSSNSPWIHELFSFSPLFVSYPQCSVWPKSSIISDDVKLLVVSVVCMYNSDIMSVVVR